MNAEALFDPPSKRLVTFDEFIEHREGGVDGLLSPDNSDAVPTGFATLDRVYLNGGGLRASQFVVLAARPGVGKTSFAGDVAINVARQGKTVAIFSLEMGAEELWTRLACNIAGIDALKLSHNLLGDAEKNQLRRGYAELSRLPIRIDDKTDLTPDLIDSVLKAAKGEIGLVIVDYLQLMVLGEARYAETTQLSRRFKLLAKKFKVPFLVLCQLNRNGESKWGGAKEAKERVPRISDLRDSGSIEQDADIVMILFEACGAEEPQDDWRRVFLSVGKNRPGMRGLVPLKFEGKHTRFSEVALGEIPAAADNNTEAEAEQY